MMRALSNHGQNYAVECEKYLRREHVTRTFLTLHWSLVGRENIHTLHNHNNNHPTISRTTTT